MIQVDEHPQHKKNIIRMYVSFKLFSIVLSGSAIMVCNGACYVVSNICRDKLYQLILLYLSISLELPSIHLINFVITIMEVKNFRELIKSQG